MILSLKQVIKTKGFGPSSGMSPMRAKIAPIDASSAMMRMSCNKVRVRPMPTAGPLIAAIVGLEQL
jgi:hypothetical protein